MGAAMVDVNIEGEDTGRSRPRPILRAAIEANQRSLQAERDLNGMTMPALY